MLPGEEEEDAEQRRQLTLFYAMLELLWHLCEFLFVEVLPGAGCLIQQLLEWVQHNASEDVPRPFPLNAL